MNSSFKISSCPTADNVLYLIWKFPDKKKAKWNKMNSKFKLCSNKNPKIESDGIKY